MAHSPSHIVSTISSSGCKIVVREKIKLLTHYLELHEKSKCLTSHFYSSAGMAGRLPEKLYIFLVLIMNLSYTTLPQKMDINVTLINFK